MRRRITTPGNGVGKPLRSLCGVAVIEIMPAESNGAARVAGRLYRGFGDGKLRRCWMLCLAQRGEEVGWRPPFRIGLTQSCEFRLGRFEVVHAQPVPNTRRVDGLDVCGGGNHLLALGGRPLELHLLGGLPLDLDTSLPALFFGSWCLRLLLHRYPGCFPLLLQYLRYRLLRNEAEDKSRHQKGQK